jgi:hypothetical protein
MALPDLPTSLLKIIPSYLYQQYSDDDDLQAFVSAYNGMAQDYVDWFNAVNLPIYSGPGVSDLLLDWVGEGLYGIPRPTLPFGSSQTVVVGPFNTIAFNTFTFNGSIAGTRGVGEGIGQFQIGIGAIGVGSFAPVSDDIYRRVLTWHTYKADGRQFSIPWLKRRVTRFLFEENGVGYNVDSTYDVNVTFDVDQCIIAIPASASMATVFQAAVDVGVLDLPFQYTFIVDLV